MRALRAMCPGWLALTLLFLSLTPAYLACLMSIWTSPSARRGGFGLSEEEHEGKFTPLAQVSGQDLLPLPSYVALSFFSQLLLSDLLPTTAQSVLL